MITTEQHTASSAGTDWLASAYSKPCFALWQWAGPDGIADIPAGRLFDILRVTRQSGEHALKELRSSGAAIGPVLLCSPRVTVEFLVPPGTAAEWAPLPRTTCVGTGSTLRCPTAYVVPPAAYSGRTWLIPPTGDGILTSPDLLRALIEVQRRPYAAVASDEAGPPG
jgi:hypothetical protein